MNMKKILYFAALCTLILTSCNGKKAYRIEGSFDVPDSLNFGDTVIARESFEGSWVYMCDLDGEPFDSVQVDEGEKFVFEGKVSAKDAFFAYITSDYTYGIIAIEPGDYAMTISNEVLAYGSPLNDAINDIDASVVEIEQNISDRVLAAVEAAGGNPTDSIMMPYYIEFNSLYNQLIDSVYNSNKDNLVGVYAVNIITSGAESVDELEFMLEEYDDYIANSPLMNARRDYLRAANLKYGDNSQDE